VSARTPLSLPTPASVRGVGAFERGRVRQDGGGGGGLGGRQGVVGMPEAVRCILLLLLRGSEGGRNKLWAPPVLALGFIRAGSPFPKVSSRTSREVSSSSESDASTGYITGDSHCTDCRLGCMGDSGPLFAVGSRRVEP
jgi:hypothetical protein